MRSSLLTGTIILTLMGGTTFVCAADSNTVLAQAPATQDTPADASAGGPPKEATPQTTPSKFSAENAAKDKQPLAVHTFDLTPEQKQAILKAAATARTPAETNGAAAGGQGLEPQPGAVLPAGYDMRDLPQDVIAQVPALRGHMIVKAGERVFVVTPETRIVVAEITK